MTLTLERPIVTPAAPQPARRQPAWQSAFRDDRNNAIPMATLLDLSEWHCAAQLQMGRTYRMTLVISYEFDQVKQTWQFDFDKGADVKDVHHNIVTKSDWRQTTEAYFDFFSRYYNFEPHPCRAVPPPNQAPVFVEIFIDEC